MNLNGSQVANYLGEQVFIVKGMTAGHVIDEQFTYTNPQDDVTFTKPEDPNLWGLIGKFTQLSEATTVLSGGTLNPAEAMRDAGTFTAEVAIPIVNGVAHVPPTYGINFDFGANLPEGVMLTGYGYKQETSGVFIQLTVTTSTEGTILLTDEHALGVSGTQLFLHDEVVGFLTTVDPKSVIFEILDNSSGNDTQLDAIFVPVENFAEYGYAPY